MSLLYFLLPLEAVLAFAYAFIKRNGDFALRLTIKLLASAVFILISLSCGFGSGALYMLIFLGLCTSFIGDALLLFKGSRLFLAGMAAFAVTHILYITAFLFAAPFKLIDLAFFAVYYITGIFFITRKGLNLGKLKIPVFIYMALLCFMAAKAASLLMTQLNLTAVLLAAAGAAMFAFSDLFLIYEGYYNKHNRTFGIINTLLYFSGQTMIALCAALTVINHF